MSCDYEIEDIFDVVIEPEHSMSELIHLQKKYNMTTVDLLQYEALGYSSTIPDNDLRYWLFQYQMYLSAEGDPEELIVEHFSWLMEEKNETDFDNLSLKAQLHTSADKREVITTSLSLKYQTNMPLRQHQRRKPVILDSLLSLYMC